MIINKNSKTVTTKEIILGDGDIISFVRRALPGENIPVDAKVIVKVPSSAEWSGLSLKIGIDTMLEINWDIIS